MSAWEDPAWLREVEAWVAERLDELGLPGGPAEQVHVRPWSTVLRVDSPSGRFFFKANEPALAHEAAVVAVLSARRPDVVPPPLALDLDRGWLLMDDGGTRLRDLVARERSVDRWLDVLPLYARLQRASAGEVDALLSAGCPDRRLGTLPTGLAALLDGLEGTPALTAAEHERLRDAIPHVAELCDELAAVGIPETIQHDDLNDGQVLVRDGRTRIVDWADACVSHPFLSLSVALEGVIAWGWEDVAGSVDLAPFREAYLAAFVDVADGATLARAAEVALRLGWVCRAVNADALGGEGPERAAARLRMFLDGRP